MQINMYEHMVLFTITHTHTHTIFKDFRFNFNVLEENGLVLIYNDYFPLILGLYSI